MADYYIRISDEEPVDMTKGVRFKYTGDGDSADFVIVDESSYETLVNQFNLFSNDFERAVNYNIDNILENGDKTVAHSNDTLVIRDEDSDSTLSFDDLESNINRTNSLSSQVSNLINTISQKASISQLNDLSNNITSSISNLNNTISNLSSNKADKTTTNSLQSSINNINSKIADTGWVNMTTYNSGVTKYSDYYQPQARKIGNIVMLRGAVKTTRVHSNMTGSLDNEWACFLPNKSFNPTRTMNFVQQGSGNARFLLSIDNAGDVMVTRYSKDGTSMNIPKNAWLNLHCVYFVG